jgi:hypothetical protein
MTGGLDVVPRDGDFAFLVDCEGGLRAAVEIVDRGLHKRQTSVTDGGGVEAGVTGRVHISPKLRRVR